jgi:hypothetical protein
VFNIGLPFRSPCFLAPSPDPSLLFIIGCVLVCQCDISQYPAALPAPISI